MTDGKKEPKKKLGDLFAKEGLLQKLKHAVGKDSHADEDKDKDKE